MCVLGMALLGTCMVFAADGDTEPMEAVFVELWAPPLAELWVSADGKGDQAGRAVAARGYLAELEHGQEQFLNGWLGKSGASRVLYRTQRVLNGLALLVTEDERALLASLPEVKSVSTLAYHEPTSLRSMDWVNAPEVWDPLGYGRTGAGVRVGLIDTGVDYIHKHLGGSGDPADYDALDFSSADPALFPNAKVVGGVDLAGTGATWPIPDPNDNPFDRHGHGTHIAGIVGGVGVTDAGEAYAGPYDQSPDYAGFRIAPGVAPEAELYAIKIAPDHAPVGPTALLIAGIEWALDPDQDGALDDRLDVVISAFTLGPQPMDHDGIELAAVRNAAAVGMTVVGSAGNDGDEYGYAGGWGQGAEALSVAASTKPGTYNTLVFTAYWTPPDPMDDDWVDVPIAFVAGNFAPGTVIHEGIVYAEPPLACGPISNAEDMAGKIALIDRGACTFLTKIEHATDAGAVAVIVVNNVSGTPTVMGGIEDVTIPAVMISKQDGQTIKDYLENPVYESFSVGIMDTLSTDSDVWADMIAGTSSRGPSWSEAGVALKPDVSAPGVNMTVAHLQSGNDVAVTQGASLAAAHVAGLAALLVQDDPSQTPAEIKARIMNSALHDIFDSDNQMPPRQSPSRVGAGRVDAAASMAAPMLLYDKEYPERVSVVFSEYEVVGDTVLEREVRIENRTSSALDLSLSLDALRTRPGVDASLDAPVTTLPADGALDVVIRLTVDFDALADVPDPTFTGQFAYFPETAGYLLVETDSLGDARSVRVPYYAALRPASDMSSNADALNVGPDLQEELVLHLGGQGLESNPSYEAALYCFEAHWRTPRNPALPLYDRCRAPMMAGVASDYHAVGEDVSAATLHFGVVTQADWLSAGWMSAITIAFDLNGNGVTDSSSFLNLFPYRFHHNTGILSISASNLGLNDGNSAFHYRVHSPQGVTEWFYYDVARPGLSFGGGALSFDDLDGATVPVAYDLPSLMRHGALGALLLHLDNTREQRVEFLPIKMDVEYVFGDVVYCAQDAAELSAFNIDNAYGAGGGLWHVAGPDSCGLNRDALYFGRADECDYDTGDRVTGRVQAPPLDLSAAVGPVYLTFDYKLETEGHQQWDLASVMVQVEGSPELRTLAANYDTGLAAQKLQLTDPALEWRTAVLDLSAYIGETIHVFFVFDSVDDVNNAYLGFAVSRFCVYEQAAFPDAALTVLPMTPFAFEGPEGGYFTPGNVHYTVNNATAADLLWRIETLETLFAVTPDSGTLASGASQTVTITPAPESEALAPGHYQADVVFHDDTNALSHIRVGELHVLDWKGLQWSPIADHQGGEPQSVTVNAVDGAGQPILRYEREVQLSAWLAGGPNASQVLITEIRPGGHAAIEIQNVSGLPVETDGWFVVIGDDNMAINNVNAERWLLPSSMATDSILYRTEDPDDDDNYWGAPIDWDINRPGWAMLVDNFGFIVDFVAWGWLDDDIEIIGLVVDGFDLDIAREWIGDGVTATTSPTVSIQRVGNQDTNNAGNFLLAEPASIGVQNAAIVLPFILPDRSLPFAPSEPVQFADGTWTGDITVFGETLGTRLLADDGQGMTGVSNAFDTSPPAVRVVNVTADPVSGAFREGATLDILVVFSEAVEVVGIPLLDLNVGVVHSVPYESGSGTNTLRFLYTVLDNHNTSALEYTGIGALRDDGGTVRDAATGTRDAILTLPAPGAAGSLGANTNIAVDTIKPVVALLGEAEVTIECGDAYNDSGAYAYDNIDGDLTSEIDVDNPVNPDVVGVYTVTYSVTDAAGNEADAVTRTVTVENTVAPELTIVGGNALDAECGISLTLPDASAFDLCDGPLSADIVDWDGLNPAAPEIGVYHVLYRAEDAVGNSAEETLVVNVADTHPPEIVLLGDDVLTFECGVDVFDDPGATAWDACEGDLADHITVDYGMINTDALSVGAYQIVYTVEDAQGNAAAPVARTVVVEDTEAPALTLGELDGVDVDEAGFALIECGDAFEEPDAFVAWDACAGDLGMPVETLEPGEAGVTVHAWALDDSGNVVWVEDEPGRFLPLVYAYDDFAARPGAYLLVYVAWDDAGNSYPTLDADGLPPFFDEDDELDILNEDGNLKIDYVRLVRVRDTMPPIITLQGDAEIFVNCGETYEDPGVTAWDACDGDLSAMVNVENPVDTNIPGEYTVTYYLSDSSGNPAEHTTRVVVVLDNCSLEGEDIPAEGEPAEGEAEGETEGEAPAEGEAEGETEGEAPAEGEAEGETEGEAPAEGEVEGEAPAEGEGEGEWEGEDDPGTGCGCFRSCRNPEDTGKAVKQLLGDWLLMGLTVMTLLMLTIRKGRA